MSQCKKFSPNIFNKAKCSNCFRQKEEHSAEALECNRASRAIARSGYLFVAPDWDFSVPLNRTKRWQRRWFVLYDDGELNYSVDEHPDTVPQGSVDMCKVLEVTGAEQVTGHPHSLALTSPDRVTFIKAASREDARWWLELLAVFPRRHKRNATFPGGRASPSLPQLGRSASPQPPRPRHLSVTGPSPRTNFLTPPLKEERESPTKEESPRPVWLPEPTLNVPIEQSPLSRSDYVVTSGSPPTRDKLQYNEKLRSRRDWRNERLRDIATALTDRSPESSLALPSEGLLHLKKGWLWLKSGTEWLKRWWILCGPTLSAFLDQDEQKTPEITIELSTITGFNETTTETRYGLQIYWSGPALTLSAVTAGIRTNWLQALRKAVPDTPDSPITPATPRSLLLSSDEEYKTASEGGRRGSEDWGELPPSPPLIKATSHMRVKERARARLKVPRSQSRQSTLDSVSTDELDTAKDNSEAELCSSLKKQSAEIDDLRKQLCKAVSEVQSLESELARLKNIQSESLVRKKQADELLLNFEKNEHELNQRLKQADDKYLRDTKLLQHHLHNTEVLVKESEKRCNVLLDNLQDKEKQVVSLQADLNKAKVQVNEKHICNHITSFSDLTNVKFSSDLHILSHSALIEQCLDLRSRFENAVTEIRAIKREMREAYIKCDDLELQNTALQKDLEINQQESEAQLTLMASRLQDLTNKLLNAEKQARSLKSKLQDSREKRRSLSLKGKESTSINKEVEDKVTELEAKILAIEKTCSQRKLKRDRTSERISPDGRSSPAHRSVRRLRRKSLDSATTSEPMKLLIRLTELESRISSAANSTESLNTVTTSASETNIKRLEGHDKVGSTFLSVIKEKVNECIQQVSLLKHIHSPNIDQVMSLEYNLLELRGILDYDNCEANLIASSVNSVVKQFEILLRDKLKDIARRKKYLKESGKLDLNAELSILAEKIAYENILISRIQESFKAPTTAHIECDRLVSKEVLETSHLITSLQAKLNNNEATEPPMNKTSIEYLTKVLAKCLITAARGFSKHKKIGRKFKCEPILETLHSKQTLLNSTFTVYKATKLPQLADALATETLNLNSDATCRLRPLDNNTIGEAWTAAHETVNTELIQSEINHILMRAAQVYEANTSSDHNFFFSFFASERAALELWSDAVEDQLQSEMQKSIKELNDYYQNSLNKMQRQNWRRRVESERIGITTSNLLKEFADIVAHKALIDARISVLTGEFMKNNDIETEEIDEPDHFITDLLNNSRLSENLSSCGLVQINQSLESEFKCIFNSFSDDCLSTLDRYNLKEVVEALRNIGNEVCEIQKSCDPDSCVSITSIEQIRTWTDVCAQCQNLQRCLVTTRNLINNIKEIGSRSKISESEEERRPLYLGTEYLTQVENLRGAYRRILSTSEGHLQQCDVEQLQILCERVLMAMDHWHRRSLQDLKESHAIELQVLRQEKEQALAEETQATLAALDAMRKAHEAEVQKEIVKFKQDFSRQQQNELLELTDRLSVKCLEAAALEEQLGSTTRQLAHAHQHILQLERNPQLSVQN